MVTVAFNKGLPNVVGIKATYYFHYDYVPTICYIGVGYQKGCLLSSLK